MVLVCISQVSKGVERLVTCVLATCVSPLEKGPFKTSSRHQAPSPANLTFPAPPALASISPPPWLCEFRLICPVTHSTVLHGFHLAPPNPPPDGIKGAEAPLLAATEIH